jgi:hypothetical protein
LPCAQDLPQEVGHVIIRQGPEGTVGITQNDHAWLSGALARLWAGAGAPLPREAVEAVGLHDVASAFLDFQPWRDEETGLLYDFVSHPPADKIAALGAGLDALERLRPYACLLVSRHYSSFRLGHSSVARRFYAGEERRRERLERRLSAQRPDLLARADVDFAVLQLLDNVSLYVCLHRPGTKGDGVHPWFRDGLGRLPDTGEVLRATFLDERTLALAPFPFAPDRLRVAVPRHRLDRHGSWQPTSVLRLWLVPQATASQPAT